MEQNPDKIEAEFIKWVSEPTIIYTYQLTHHYSTSNIFCAAKTDMTLDEIHMACSYLQLIRFKLPVMEGPEDTLGEEGMMWLLNELFGLETITTESDVDDVIDLHWNWEEYCGKWLNTEYLNLHYAKKNAYKAVLELMVNEAKENIERVEQNKVRKGWFYEGREDEFINKVKNNIPRFQAMIDGKKTRPEWNFITLDGKSCSNKIYVKNDDNMPDYIDI